MKDTDTRALPLYRLLGSHPGQTSHSVTGNGNCFTEFRSVGLGDVEAHVSGTGASIGVNPFVDERRVAWAGLRLEPMRWFTDPSGGPYLVTEEERLRGMGLDPHEPEVLSILSDLHDRLRELRLPPRIYRTNSGWQVVVLFEKPVLARVVRRIFLTLLRELGVPDASNLLCPSLDWGVSGHDQIDLPLFGGNPQPIGSFFIRDDEKDWLSVPAAGLGEFLEGWDLDRAAADDLEKAASRSTENSVLSRLRFGLGLSDFHTAEVPSTATLSGQQRF